MASRCRLHLTKKKREKRKEEEQKEVPKSIWIRDSIRETAKDGVQYAWFKLNPKDPKIRGSSRNKKKLTQLPLPPMPPSLQDGAGFAISASRIYVLGGGGRDSQKSRDVYILDLDDTGSSSRWIPGPQMLYPRFYPVCVIVDGKVYVFGGLLCDGDDPLLGEVFDPTTNKWEALPRTSAYKDCADIYRYYWFSITAATEADECGKRYIPVHLSGSPYLMGLRLEDYSWFCVDSLFETSCLRMVLADDVIYGIYGKKSCHEILAYHLPTAQSVLVHSDVVADYDSRLLYIGNNKFWLVDKYNPDYHFVEFKVHKNYEGPALVSISITSVSSGKFRCDVHDLDVMISV